MPLLLALAPSPRPLAHAVVAALAGGDGSALRATLVAVRDAALLVEDEAGWRFRHELLRRSLFETLTAAGRRDAHRAVAEALGEEGGAAALAMHYAEAGDGRAVAWARRAAAAARAVDAHVEALAQLERALAFPMPDVERRDVLVLAAREAFELGLVEDGGRYAEAAAAIPGGSPEARARTYQTAARMANLRGDLAADEAHLAAAEAALAGEPPSAYALSIMVSRLARAANAVEPAQVEMIAARALRLADSVDDPGLPFLLVGLRTVLAGFALCTGDPAGFTALEDLLSAAEARAIEPGFAITALKAGYEEATFSLFLAEAAALWPRFEEGARRHGLNWAADAAPYRVLEHVERGDYVAAHALERGAATPAPGSIESAVLTFASVMHEARAGSLDRARAMLVASPMYDALQQRACLELAALEVASVALGPDLGERAAALYALVEPHHYARPAGVAAVALARAGREPPPLPAWLAAASPLRVFWRWAAALADADTAALREVAARLAAMHLPYEAALALADAGELAAAYRALNDLGAGEARARLAARMRAAGLSVPRRTRADAAGDGLTETERDLCRRVAAGDTNEQIAAALFVSVRTVESHLTTIYRKTGLRGRAALAAWWVQPGRTGG